MSVKFSAMLFSALNVFVFSAAAQSIFDKAPKSQQESKESQKPAAAAALATLTGAASDAKPSTPVAPPAPKPANVTIKDLAAKQAESLAADADKRINPTPPPVAPPVAGPILPAPIVGEFSPASPIPITMANRPKPLEGTKVEKADPVKPARPYLAAVVGFAGKETVEIHVGSHIRTLKVGDSIDKWTITSIIDGKLMLSGTSSKKVNKKVVTQTSTRVMSVGDSL